MNYFQIGEQAFFGEMYWDSEGNDSNLRQAGLVQRLETSELQLTAVHFREEK